MNGLVRFAAIGLLMLLAVSLATAQLDSVGGPYTPDANTMMLLHFDGDYTNAGHSGNAISKGNPAAQFFIPGISGLGQCLRIQNDNQTDSSYVIVKDTSTLSLTGDWTIEGWVNIFTFGGVSSWNWVPRLIIKPGDDLFYLPNYFVEMWGDVRKFSCGYYDGTYNNPPVQWSNWPQANSPDNSFNQGQWVHLTFIRDSTRQFVATLVHDENRALLFYSVYFYDTVYQAHPTPNHQDVYMGWAGTPTSPSTDSYLDGFVDEIRVSNIRRNFPVPPIIQAATQLENQPSTLPQFTINAVVEPFITGATITSVNILYNTGTGWQQAAMSNTGGKMYSGGIPAQPVGTKVRYYVEAKDNYNLRAIYPAAAEFDTTTQYRFAVYEPNSKTLHLTFEEGPGIVPADHSSYNEAITTYRIPDYSTDAKVGAFSLLLQNNPAKIDSNWVEVDPTFVGGPEFCVDFWANPDSAKNQTQIISLPSLAGDPNNNNYEISMIKKPLGADILFTARYSRRSGSPAVVMWQTTVKPTLGSWYHLIFERNATTKRVAFVVRDANDVLLNSVARVDSTPVMGLIPLRVGRGIPSAGNYWTLPPFRGKLDDVKIFNYPEAGITGVDDEPQAVIPHAFSLNQNYPNPFNPTTLIQFSIPSAGGVQLVVSDLLGRTIRTLVDEPMHAGDHRVQWDGRDGAGHAVATGVYFYTLKAADRVAVRKMLLLR